MDRLDRMPRSTDDIVNKTPIIVGSDTPKGYTGIRTTIQIRDLRVKNDAPDEDEFRLDAVVNTEIRKSTFFGKELLQTLSLKHHREVAELLLSAIREAAKEDSKKQ